MLRESNFHDLLLLYFSCGFINVFFVVVFYLSFGLSPAGNWFSPLMKIEFVWCFLSLYSSIVIFCVEMIPPTAEVVSVFLVASMLASWRGGEGRDGAGWDEHP